MKTRLSTSFIAFIAFLSACAAAPKDEAKTCRIIFDNPSCGYAVDITRIPQGWLYHFTQGDSVDCYVPLTVIPKEVEEILSAQPQDTCIHTDHVFTQEDKMYKKFFFKDVNFDNKPEFVVSTFGNGWQDFNCYDLAEARDVNTLCALDFVRPIGLRLFGNFGFDPITGDLETYIEEYYKGPDFDYENKTITMHGRSGVDTWYDLTYKYIGKNRFEMTQYKLTVCNPIFDDTGDCTAVTYTESLYKPHPTIPDSLILIHEKEVERE